MEGDLVKIVDAYQNLRCDREVKTRKFINGERSFLVYQASVKRELYTDADSKEDLFERYIKYISKCLAEKSDHIPAMQPWFGTGVYANMYGCKYYWRKGEAPATRNLYQSLDDIGKIRKPRWEDSEIAQLIMDTIRYMKSKTGDAIPISYTDTQSAGDTATLIVDACEIFSGCMSEPELVMDFMTDINDLVIGFSVAQAELIGDALIKPGHVMFSDMSFRGISISDDNLALISPRAACEFNLKLDEEVGKAMGGVAIHSCGRWEKTMSLVRDTVPSCVLLHCSLSTDWDTNPNNPEDVRDALAGKGIPVHVRVSGNTEKMLAEVSRVMHPGLRIVVQPQYVDEDTAERNYHALNSLLSGFYNANTRIPIRV